MSSVPNSASDSINPTPWNSEPAMAEKMQRLNRLANLGLLSAGMAHEIKNGMVAIKTFVDLLLEKNQDADLGEVVRHELDRINSIVTQMLRFATPGHGAFTTVRVHEVLDLSLRLLQPQLSAKLITLQKHFRAEADTVSGEAAQLQQVFMNLLLNALEAMRPHGTLTVSTEISSGENGVRAFHIQIQDTGVGIAMENLTRLFEPFFTTKKNGTGLGLAICQRIMHEHHGSIAAQNGPGKGSTFRLSLPTVTA